MIYGVSTVKALNFIFSPLSGLSYSDRKSFVNYGNYIVYTVAPGDVLSGIGQRFGVSYMQIAQWNNIKNPDKILIGQKLTIYPAVIR